MQQHTTLWSAPSDPESWLTLSSVQFAAQAEGFPMDGPPSKGITTTTINRSASGGSASSATTIGTETTSLSQEKEGHRDRQPSILSPAGSRSHAKISPWQVMESVWMGSVADYSGKLSDSLASADLPSFSWKTSQLSLFGDLTAYSWDSMRAGMMRDGALFQLERWVPRTSGSASGYWPTPTAAGYGSNQSASEGAAVRPSLNTMAAKWPTPMATDGTRGPTQFANGTQSLGAAAKLWPTPTVCGDYNHVGASETSGDGLATVARRWSVPAGERVNTGYQRPLPGESSPAYWKRMAEYERANGILPEMLSGGMKWPTPRASDGSKGGPNQTQAGQPSLAALAASHPSSPALSAARWATPKARDWKGQDTPSAPGQRCYSPSGSGCVGLPMDWRLGSSRRGNTTLLLG